MKHIEYTIAKSNTVLGFIKRNSSDFTDPYTLKCLYNAYVRSILEYGCVIWNPHYNIHSTRIENVQKKFTRFVIWKLGWNIETPSYSTRCKQIDIQSLENRRKMNSVLFVSDILSYRINCSSLLSLIDLYAPSRPLRTRFLFFESDHRTNYAKNESVTRCVREVNRISCVFDFDFILIVLPLNVIICF